MYAQMKESLPVHSLRFGVNDHGVIVPILRRSKGFALRMDLIVRPLQLGLRWAPKSR